MARSALSKEFVEESASEGEEEEQEESGSDSSEPTPTKSTTKSQKKQKLKSASPSSGTDSSASNSGSENCDSDDVTGSEGESGSGKAAAPKTNGLKRKNDSQVVAASSKKSKSTPSHIPSRSYQPPTGFLPIKTIPPPMSMLSATNLESKQIWHITAASTIPLTLIKTLDIQAALRGEPILEHQGVRYNMQAVPVQTESLLVPSPTPFSTGNGSETTVSYESVNNPITRSFCLREMTSIKGTNELATNQSSSSTSQKSPRPGQNATNTRTTAPDSQLPAFFAHSTASRPGPRQQPTGLLMRYHPFGSGRSSKERMSNPEQDIDLSSSDDEQHHRHRNSRLEIPDSQKNGFTVPDGPESSEDDDVLAVAETPRPRKKGAQEKGSKDRHAQGKDKVLNHRRPAEKEKKKKHGEKAKKTTVTKETQSNDHDDHHGHDIDVDPMDIDDGPVASSSPKKKDKNREKKKEKHKRKQKTAVET